MPPIMCSTYSIKIRPNVFGLKENNKITLTYSIHFSSVVFNIKIDKIRESILRK